MRLRRLVSALVLAGLFPLCQAMAAHAATCDTSLSLEEALTASSVVFVGKVTEVDARRTEATVRVQAVWKGPDLPAHVDVVGGFEGDDSKRTFNPGATYLFMPSTRRAPFIDDLCSGTRFYSAPALLIPPHLVDAAGTDSARQPLEVEVEEGAASASWVPIAAGMLVLLTLVGFASMYRRLLRAEPKRARDELEPKPIFKPVRRRRREGKVGAFTNRGSRAARKAARAGRRRSGR